MRHVTHGGTEAARRTGPAVPSLAATLDRIAPRIPGQLISTEAASRIRRVAAGLPAALTHWIYFECRLSRDAPRVDLSVRVDRRARDLLAGLNPAIRVDARMRATSEWARVEAFARRWAGPTTALHDAVQHTWLEFDLVGDDIPVPRVFVDFAPQRMTAAGGSAPLHLAVEALAPLVDSGVIARVARGLRVCFAALPDGAEVPYVGLLPAPHDREAVRVCVKGLCGAALARYLRAVGWPGELDELAPVLAAVAAARGDPPPSPAVVHLDIGARPLPRIAFEYGLARRPQIRGEFPAAALLDSLVARGLCDPRKRAGLPFWPGCARENLAHEFWPSLMIRRVNHIKVVHQPGLPVEVKAYLSVSHEFWRAQPVSTE